MEPVGSFQELEEFAVCMFLINCKHGKIFTTFFSRKGSNPLQDSTDRKLNEMDVRRLFCISVLLI